MKRPVPVILQYEAAECGLACVAMVAGHHGCHVDLPALRLIHDPSSRGASARDIMHVGDALDFNVRTMKAGLQQLDKLQLPVILHWDLVHYVVLVSIGRDGYVIHDPAVGRRTIEPAEFSRSYTGIALEFTPRPEMKPRRENRPVSFGWLLDGSVPYGKLLGLIFAMSTVMQALLLIVPFTVQLLVDQVALSRDTWLLAAGMGGIMLAVALYALLLWLRSTAIIFLNQAMDLAGSQKLIARMLRLPYEFFARRDTGSLLARFSNLRELRQLLTQGLAESAVEAVLASVVLLGMAMYLPAASAVAVLALAAYAAYRVATRTREQDRVAEMFHLMSTQYGSLVETMQKVQTIKANAIELSREQFWLGRYVDYQNALASKLRTDYAKTLAMIVCFGSGYAATGWIALAAYFDARLSMGESLTVLLLLGMFFARVQQFLERLFELQVARVHLDGLADVVHGETERRGPAEAWAVADAARIEVRDLGFRYSASDPFVFRGVSFIVEPGQCVVITGPSGCGKSTLLAVLLGLWQPTEGEILIDGVPIGQIPLDQLRRRFGSVLQNDRLFYGTVRENVTLFEMAPPQERVDAALKAAAIDQVVSSLPMKEHTLMLDTATLSGGEVQRILLARALYKQPPVLLLDEASSHLDAATEHEVNRAVRALGATRLMVAHRSQTIELADVEIQMGWSAERGATSVLHVLPRVGEPRRIA